MTARRLVPFIIGLAAAACDSLRSDPGGDFAVKVVDDAPIAAVGQIAVPVRFTVSGCATFESAVLSVVLLLA